MQQMSNVKKGGAVCREFESEAPVAVLDRAVCSREQHGFQMCLDEW